MDITNCLHCDRSVPAGGAVRYRGCTYHPHCLNCFMCGEIDLLNAGTFKGVIFCSACAERIFAGCPASPRAPPRRRSTRMRPRGVQTPTVLYASTIPAPVHTLSLDKITAQNAMDTETEPADTKTSSSPAARHLVPPQHPERCEQLETVNVPAPPGLPTNQSASKEHKSTAADVGLAELGASVELAQVALRRPSSVTLVIKSGSAFNLEQNESLSRDFKPGTSASQAVTYSSSGCERPPGDRIGSFWRRKRLSSMLKIPFKLFKRNILDKSSFITVYARAEQPGLLFLPGSGKAEKKTYVCRSPLRGLRDLFHDEISEHHSRGARVLYGTINRLSAPYELGWVHAATCQTKRKRCRHYRTSHGYRCLRAHVMKRAGPTRSELEQLRGKIKQFVTGAFVCRMLEEANLTTTAVQVTFGLDDDRYPIQYIPSSHDTPTYTYIT